LVVEDGKLVGIITESDLFDAMINIFGFRRPGVRLVIETENRIGAYADLLTAVAAHNISVIGLACIELGEKVQVVLRLAISKADDELITELNNKGFLVQSVN